MRKVEFPHTTVEAARSLQRHLSNGHATLVIGGGTLTIPSISHGYATPSRVIDLGRTGSQKIEASTTEIRVGAMVTYQHLILSPIIRRELRILHLMANGITGGIQIRNQGTLGGAACAARPHSDAPAVLTALEAQMIVQSPEAQRRVAAADFFAGAERNAMCENEILSEIVFPRKFTEMRTAYYKLKFAESSWPVITASCLLPPPSIYRPQTAGLVVLGGLAAVPVMVSIQGRQYQFDEHAATTEVRAAVEAIPTEKLWSDLRAPSDYRRHVAPEIARRALQLAQAAVGGTQ
jgi:CO/xanthine dehydrogenase FAD-binding subunit